MPCKRTFPIKVLTGAILLLCGCSDGLYIEISNRPLELHLALQKLAADHLELTVTTNFHGATDIWRDGQQYDQIEVQPETPTIFTDFAVVHGNRYCYVAGGYYFWEHTSVWSNEVCVDY